MCNGSLWIGCVSKGSPGQMSAPGSPGQMSVQGSPGQMRAECSIDWVQVDRVLTLTRLARHLEPKMARNN